MHTKLTRPQIEEIVRAKIKEKLNEDTWGDGSGEHRPGTPYTPDEIKAMSPEEYAELKARDPWAGLDPRPAQARTPSAAGLAATTSDYDKRRWWRRP